MQVLIQLMMNDTQRFADKLSAFRVYVIRDFYHRWKGRYKRRNISDISAEQAQIQSTAEKWLILATLTCK